MPSVSGTVLISLTERTGMSQCLKGIQSGSQCLSVTDSLYPLSEGALKRVGKVEDKKIRRGKKCGITYA